MRIQTEPDFGKNWQIYLSGILTTDAIKTVKQYLRINGIEYPTIVDFKAITEHDFENGRNINFTSLKSFMMFKQMIK
jgi:hypothetical protein